jgi:hypothetical protein
MGDDNKFDQNFMWYEWSFVSPEEMPCDEAPTGEVEGHGMSVAVSPPFTWSDAWTEQA